ncbi:hypothetical protein RclHR1_17430002 [Rhizophagus clarus]|uniref:Protein kinase domain-containing protein n=1 Tax=Rhizophagus clarus TaxID=94130 RepID=A0A2Z6RCV0_9GLOM|nr:hypothetical protein RclHR1_17430002 [Rhizophagus clarus]
MLLEENVKTKFGVFKSLDYDLNFDERKMKFKKYSHVICEDCNQEIEKSNNFICYNCYNKETDCNEQNRMNYGICKVCFRSNASFGCCDIKIFQVSDYKLNSVKRKIKYMDDNIFCEKCNSEIDEEYYCKNCYNEEADIIKRRYMKYGSNFGIFSRLDYNLNLEKRRKKYKNFDGVFCEKCNNEIDEYYCKNCYNEEADIIKKYYMKYGSNFKIFSTLDYNLNLKERREKYKDFNTILCEKCNNEIHKWNYCQKYKVHNIIKKGYYNEKCNEKCKNNIYQRYYYCQNCYDEETDIIKKGHMKYGSNFEIFSTLDYNLNLEKRKAKYKNFYIIFCEKCNNNINKRHYYCRHCYDKENDINKKGYMKYGSNFKIFNTLDYNLNLEERMAKYKNFAGIFCEKCNNEIDKWKYYCKGCYNEETDIIKKNYMKYGLNFKIFNTLDYNLNLEEKKAKYKNFYFIFCEKCNNDINTNYYYCENCYYEETDIIKKGYMKYGSNFKIFSTLDYNLNLEERKAKYKNFDGIFCEKCNNEIVGEYYCKNCYNKEADVIKQGYMKYGSNFEIFSTLDYNLNLEERMAKYMEYDYILCEKCNNEIDKQYYNCNKCYNNQIMTSKCKVCFIGNNGNCCLFYEFQQFLEDFYKWINENKFIDDYLVIKKQKGEISDYDLDEEDRRVKYKDFDYILCEKCDKKYHYNYCYNCYIKEINELIKLKSILQPKLQDYENFCSKICNKETKELRELKELQSILKYYKNVYFKLDGDLGIFKQIIKEFEKTKYQIENRKSHINNIRYNVINNCGHVLRSYCGCYDKETDIDEKKRMELGKCKECLKIHKGLNGCLSCNPKHFQRDFNKWTSKNEIIDKLIQENQLAVRRYGLLEWIPYDKFINIKYIAEGGFAKVYSAIWIGGRIRKWSQFSNSWKRDGSTTTVALKVLNNSENISEDFLNEIKFFNEVSGELCVIKCFGITQDPITCNYALVLQYMENGDLRKYLKRTVNLITWDQRLNKIYDICLALVNIHKHKLMHKDLHPGNIFIDSTFAYIGDFGFCMPANENTKNSNKKNIYGVLPYMAPEILRGKPHTLASDIYSLGVIINEIITVIPPFNNQPHDHFLALDICRGLRPNIRAETPDFLKELIKKCWNANPENRPSSKEIFYILSDRLNEYKNMALTLSYNLNESDELQSHPLATYMSRLLNFQKLPEPINFPNQQKFISSRYIKKKQSGHVSIFHSDECSDCIIMDID